MVVVGAAEAARVSGDVGWSAVVGERERIESECWPEAADLSGTSHTEEESHPGDRRSDGQCRQCVSIWTRAREKARERGWMIWHCL